MKARGNESFFREYLHILLHVSYIWDILSVYYKTQRKNFLSFQKALFYIDMKKCMPI